MEDGGVSVHIREGGGKGRFRLSAPLFVGFLFSGCFFFTSFFSFVMFLLGF